MAANPYILARSMREAHAFAREELRLAHGKYRIVNSISTISSVRGADLYLVPGYMGRFDRFAIGGALRYTRMNVIHWVPVQAEAPDDLEPPGAQLTLISNEQADGFFCDEIRELESHLEPEGFALSDDPAVQAEQILNSAAHHAEDPAPRTRRRRCSECGDLVEPQDVDQHAADHFTIPGE